MKMWGPSTESPFCCLKAAKREELRYKGAQTQQPHPAPSVGKMAARGNLRIITAKSAESRATRLSHHCQGPGFPRGSGKLYGAAWRARVAFAWLTFAPAQMRSICREFTPAAHVPSDGAAAGKPSSDKLPKLRYWDESEWDILNFWRDIPKQPFDSPYIPWLLAHNCTLCSIILFAGTIICESAS
jgi:hypothetical protein